MRQYNGKVLGFTDFHSFYSLSGGVSNLCSLKLHPVNTVCNSLLLWRMDFPESLLDPLICLFSQQQTPTCKKVKKTLSSAAMTSLACVSTTTTFTSHIDDWRTEKTNQCISSEVFCYRLNISVSWCEHGGYDDKRRLYSSRHLTHKVTIYTLKESSRFYCTNIWPRWQILCFPKRSNWVFSAKGKSKVLVFSSALDVQGQMDKFFLLFLLVLDNEYILLPLNRSSRVPWF